MASKKKSKKKAAKKPAARKVTKKKAAKKKVTKKAGKKKAAKKATKKKAASGRVGRPPLPKKELRSKVFCVRLRGDEWKKIEAAAGNKGLSAADWAIQKLMKGL